MGDKRRDSGEFYPGGRIIPRSGATPPQVIIKWSDIRDKPQISRIPEKYTDKDMKNKVNEIASQFGAVVVWLALAFMAFGAGVNVHTAAKEDIYNDGQIVTNVTLDTTGLITTETDPTVPNWAKSSSKPSYVWNEISGRPSRLPNPSALQIKYGGMVRMTYDGATASAFELDMPGEEWVRLGRNAQSSGSGYSTAIGTGSKATGSHSAALGAGGVVASGANSLALGNSVQANGESSTAVGYSAFANGAASSAFGGNTYANGLRSLATGWAAIADALNSTAVGNAARVHAGAIGAVAIGSGATVGTNATNALQIGFGTNNDPDTLQYGNHKVILNRDISPTNGLFSAAVLAVGLNIDTNSVAQINAILEDLGGVPIEGTATTVGGLLLALAAAVAWLKKNALRRGMTGGVPDDPDVSSLFSCAPSVPKPTPTGRLNNAELESSIMAVVGSGGDVFHVDEGGVYVMAKIDEE